MSQLSYWLIASVLLVATFWYRTYRAKRTLAGRLEEERQRARQMSEDVRKRVMTSLVSASALYFSGNYAAARAELGKLNYAEGFPAVQMRLFRAASAYALFLTGRQRDEKLLQEAAANVRECRRLAAAGFRPDPKAFSPRFVLFFNQTS